MLRTTQHPDTLTYSLGGTDAKHFVIVGSVEYPTGYDLAGGADLELTGVGDQGALIFKPDNEGIRLPNVDATRVLDYETKKQYVVTVFATDPSGDGKGRTSVKVYRRRHRR